MKKSHYVMLCLGIECSLILFIAIACTLESFGFALFYNIGYGVLMSIIVPLIVSKESLSSFGFKKLKIHQYTVLLLFVLFSVGGQLIPIMISGNSIQFNLI